MSKSCVIELKDVFPFSLCSAYPFMSIKLYPWKINASVFKRIQIGSTWIYKTSFSLVYAQKWEKQSWDVEEKLQESGDAIDWGRAGRFQLCVNSQIEAGQWKDQYQP